MAVTLLTLAALPVRHTLWSGPLVQAVMGSNAAQSTITRHTRNNTLFISTLQLLGQLLGISLHTAFLRFLSLRLPITISSSVPNLMPLKKMNLTYPHPHFLPIF